MMAASPGGWPSSAYGAIVFPSSQLPNLKAHTRMLRQIPMALHLLVSTVHSPDCLLRSTLPPRDLGDIEGVLYPKLLRMEACRLRLIRCRR
jgi:hypothetical protein